MFADDRRRYFRACALGALGATVVFVVALLGGHFSLLQRSWRGNFFDTQAHSLVHWRWDVPAGSLGNEGWVLNGKTYMYFGPFPALLRLPVAAITHTFDGRLTQISMLVAFALILVAIGHLGWQVRAVTRCDQPLDRVERCVIAGYVVMAVVGTPILFIATELFVYNEAVIWGLAWTLLTISAAIDFSVTRHRRQLALAAFCATGAVLSRGSLGATALLVLGLFAAAAAVPMRWRPTLGLRELELTHRDAVALAGSCLVAVVLYAYQNMAKFGTLFSVPFTKELYESRTPKRLHNLKIDGGGLFSLKFIPTTALQYLRPDAITWHWPWPNMKSTSHAFLGMKLELPGAPTSSVVDSMLVFSALALIGVIWILRTSPEGPNKHILVIPLTAGIIGSAATLSYGYLAQRYLLDLFPFIVVASLIGLNTTIDWFRSSKPAARRIASAGLLALIALNIWVSIGFATIGQHGREHNEICFTFSPVNDCILKRVGHQ